MIEIISQQLTANFFQCQIVFFLNVSRNLAKFFCMYCSHSFVLFVIFNFIFFQEIFKGFDLYFSSIFLSFSVSRTWPKTSL